MAVSDHLKIASTELMKAAELVKQEIEQLRKDETNTLRDMDNQIADLSRQILRQEHDLRVSDNPDQNSRIQTTISRIGAQIAAMRADERRRQSDIENAIRSRQNLVNDLESKARMVMP